MPKGGNIVYLQGPVDYSAAVQRTAGMQQRKPANANLIMLRGLWTEESGYQAISSWARLSTSQKLDG